MKLDPVDWALSMTISKKPKDSAGDLPMRSVLVHRLRTGAKAVLRKPLKSALSAQTYGVYCEPCEKWTRDGSDGGDEYECPGCQRIYVLEFAVFAVLPGSEPQVSRKEKE